MNELLSTILRIPAVLIAFTFHELAHAVVADRLGDKTPRFQGRITLNPFAHIDIMGFVLILLAGFGWAKPVQTNPSAYKNYYKDDLKVSIAGPLANLGVAIVFTIIYALFSKYVPITNNVLEIIDWIIIITIRLNCVLFILNLIPIPGFDGFHVLRDLFPKFFYNLPEEIYRYQMIIFIALIAPILPGGNSVFTYIVGVPALKLNVLLFRLAGIM